MTPHQSANGRTGSRALGAGRGPRVPPHDLDAESSLLGAMMLSKDAIAAGLEHCRATDFYKPVHGHVFDAIAALYAQGEPADPITIGDELRRDGLLDQVGGIPELISLQANTPAVSSASRYAAIVSEMALLRHLIGIGAEIAEIGWSLPEDTTAALDRAEALLYAASSQRRTDSLVEAHALMVEVVDQLEARCEAKGLLTGIPTGYVDLDRRLGGLRPANLVIIGGRPGSGKTALGLGIAAHAAMEAAAPVLVVSLEMSRAEVGERLIAGEARIDLSLLRNGRLNETHWAGVTSAVARIGAAPIVIDDDPGATVFDVRARARRLKSSSGLGLVIVDYLQLMLGRPGAESRQVQVAEISRSLKLLARELEVPVVALSQLSRNLEARGDKRPTLADLRESGSLENDADVVLMVYRDQLYHPESADRGTAEISIAKHRNGPTGAPVRLAFLESYARFANMAARC